MDRKEYKKQYYLKNKEKIRKYRKQYDDRYYRTVKGKKNNRINKWKSRGVIFFDFDLLNEIYINTTHCDLCNVKLTEDRWSTSTTRCLDHDHTITEYDNVRNVLCQSCNVKRK